MMPTLGKKYDIEIKTVSKSKEEYNTDEYFELDGVNDMMTTEMQYTGLNRIVVVGTSCAGKTSFARKLSACLDISHIELDALFWKPKWEERPVPEFRKSVARETAAERWVADGNYSSVRDIVWGRSTDVVWLNYPFSLVLYRAFSRTVCRAFTREELFSGNRESFRQSFFSRDSILLWVLKTYSRNQMRYTELKFSDEWSHLRFTEFRQPSEASTFLSQFKTARRPRTCRGRQSTMSADESGCN